MNTSASLARRTIGVSRRRFFALAGAAFWPYLALIVVFAVARLIVSVLLTPQPPIDPQQLWRSYSVLSKISVIVAFIATASLPWGLSTAGVSLIVCAEDRGNPVSLRKAAAQLMRRLPALVVLSLILGAALTILSALFFVPGLIAVAIGYPAITALADEGLGIAKALKRGSQVALGRLGTILQLVILFSLVSAFATLSAPFVMARLSDPSDLAFALMIWGFIAIVPPALILLMAPVMALLYCDCCRELSSSAVHVPSPVR